MENKNYESALALALLFGFAAENSVNQWFKFAAGLLTIGWGIIAFARLLGKKV